MDQNKLLETKKLTKVYHTIYGDFYALKEVTAIIKHGRTLITGQNGSGKSTFLKIMMGLVHPTKGSFKIYGINASKSKHKKIFFMPEKPQFPKNISIYDFLKYFSKMQTIPIEKLFNQLKRFGLFESLYNKIGSLSAGMVQLLGLTMATSTIFDLLILDEPFSNLDPIWKKFAFKEFEQIIDKTKPDILISTHIVPGNIDFFDNVLIFQEGRIILNSTTRFLKTYFFNKLLSIKCNNMQMLSDLLIKKGAARVLENDKTSARIWIKNETAFKQIITDYSEFVTIVSVPFSLDDLYWYAKMKNKMLENA